MFIDTKPPSAAKHLPAVSAAKLTRRRRHIAIYLPALIGGGAERVAAILATALSAAGHHVTLVVDFEAPQNEGFVGSGVERVTLAGAHGSDVVRLADFLKKRQPEIALAIGAATNIKLVAAHLLARLTGRTSTRVVLSYHGPSSHGDGWLGWFGYPLASLLTRYASRTICVSDELVRHLVQDWRAAAKRIVRIYNAITIERARPAADARLVEARRRMAWRRKAPGWQAFAGVGDGELADLAALRARLARLDSFPAGAAVRESVRRICDGRLTFLGEAWPAVAVEPDKPSQFPSTFWFHDPITAKSWPGASVSSFDVDVRAAGEDIGDVKYVWEPNRLQMLHPLAAVIAAKKERDLHQIGFAIIASWAAANPPYQGVNWKSGIELALRVVSLTLFVAAAGPALSAAQRAEIRAVIVAHARYLVAFPSLHSSANNHRIAEGLGLFLAGALLPDLHEARGWRDEGRQILEMETMRQILPDGVGAEQSPTYQAFSMEMVALAAQLADDLRMRFRADVLERLVRGAAFLSSLCDENGFVPAVGDDDEGRVIAQPPDREPRYVASIVAAIAGLARGSGFLVPAHDPHLRDVIFDSPQRSAPGHSGLQIFVHGGVSIADETLLGRRVHLVFDHGPLGLPPLAAHGHADALAIWLTIDGEPVFIDAGTFRYFSGGDTRSALREGLAHNTLAIDGVSPSRVATGFSWKTSANARLLSADRGPLWTVAGAHDGYRHAYRVRHVRTVRREETGFFIDDQLVGEGRPLPVTLRFLCHPAVSVARDGEDVVIGGRCGALCRVVPPRGFAIELIETLHSPRFGDLSPTMQIVFAGRLGVDVATTRVDIVGSAKARARLSDGEVVASGVRSDIKETAWH